MLCELCKEREASVHLTQVIDGAIIQELDDKFQFIGEPMKIDCDVICMAVGLTPTTELFWQADAKTSLKPTAKMKAFAA